MKPYVVILLTARSGCGCTTAGSWDRQVEPGKTGVIPLQFNSTGFKGTVTKSATVACNDPGQSNAVLLLKSTVWNPFEVMPVTEAATSCCFRSTAGSGCFDASSEWVVSASSCASQGVLASGERSFFTFHICGENRL
jgi:hypothetical protein